MRRVLTIPETGFGSQTVQSPDIAFFSAAVAWGLRLARVSESTKRWWLAKSLKTARVEDRYNNYHNLDHGDPMLRCGHKHLPLRREDVSESTATRLSIGLSGLCMLICLPGVQAK